MTRSKRKVHVGIVFGGRSGEHQISLRSARCIVDAIDRESYSLSLIGIDRQGHWHVLEEPAFRRLTDAPLPVLDGANSGVMLVPAPTLGGIVDLETPTAVVTKVDVVFPVLHGPYGEDGTVQGLLELADIPYVGAGVLGSALGMDKDVQKRLLQSAGLPVVPFVTASARQWATAAQAVAAQAASLGLPLFVKPANLGSSVGITKVKVLDELPAAIEAALSYDNKIVVEKGVDAREIECAVLGNEVPEVSVPGEICPAADFYSYEAKYVDSRGATLLIPAPVTTAQTAAVQELALRVFQLLDCAGMARVDFFLERSTGHWYVNELNSIPGFTTISMYPKLWEASGIPYRDLIGRLIDLALDRHAQRSRLKKAYAPNSEPTA
ncbi:MAG: D-alanine/D-alanine ligase [Deltaproteobacteria bacterium]|nr:D-alanine/D-alanine ligase [Deltaproteobacteria bacterium]